MEHAVLPGRDHGAGLLLGGIENGLDRSFHDGRAEFGKQSRHPPLAEMRGAQHGGEVAAEFAGVADVEREQVEQVVARLAGLVQLDRRDADAFLIDFGGSRIVGAMGGAADVALVRAHHGPEQPLAAVEHRHEGGEIRQMAAAVIGIVEQDDVARRDVLEALLHRARRPGQRADMDRNVLGLRDQPAARVGDGERKIAAGIEDLRIGGAKHRLAHFLHDRAQPVLDDGARDGIDFGGHSLPCDILHIALIDGARAGSIVPALADERAFDDVADRLPYVAVELHQPHLLDGAEIRRPRIDRDARQQDRVAIVLQ